MANIAVNKVLARNPVLSVIDLAIQAVEDHRREHRCEFEDNAAPRTILDLGFSPNAKAADLSGADLERLELGLEAMETHCPHKS